MRSLSTLWGSFKTTTGATISTDYGNIQLTCSSDDFNVFSGIAVNAETNEININCAAHQTVLINYAASTTQLAQICINLSGGILGATVIHHFVAPSVEITTGIHGTVFAPRTTLRFPSGLITGTVIVQNFNDYEDCATGQINYFPFAGCVPTTAYPVLRESTCEYVDGSIPEEFYHWVAFRKACCERITTEDQCSQQGYCWYVPLPSFFQPIIFPPTNLFPFLFTTRWRDTTNQNAQARHQTDFKPPQIYNPAPGVYVAVGYDLGNSILVVNNNQAVLIDTLGSLATGQRVKAAFEEYLGGPIPTIVAVVYTHSHQDHYGGTAAFTLPVGTPIISHITFIKNLQNFGTVAGAALLRSARQFGFYLYPQGENADGWLTNAIGPFVSYDTTAKILPINPANYVPLAAPLTRTLADLTFVFYPTPGETDDTISVHIPSLGVVAIGDNVYKSFPNLYAIRGTPPRDVSKWIASIDLVRSLNPTIVIGSHSAPITTNVAATLTNYRDAIQYVLSQTLVGINALRLPDDIANSIVLPPAYANDPYLQQFYGYVPACVKSIFTSYLGWFGGNIAELSLPSTTVQAQRLVDLAGGAELATIKAASIISEGTLESAQFALRLADAINKTISRDHPLLPWVQTIYIQAAQEIGFSHVSANNRNYYLSVVEEFVSYQNTLSQAFVARNLESVQKNLLVNLPIQIFMDTPVTSRLNAAKASEMQILARINIAPPMEETFHIQDTTSYSLVIRNGIAEVYPLAQAPSQYEHHLVIDVNCAFSFKSLLLGLADLDHCLEEGAISSNGSVEELAHFFDLFQ